jgi:hypothetical protein
MKADRKKTEQLKQKLEEQLKEGKREKPSNNTDSDGSSGVRQLLPLSMPKPRQLWQT